MAKKMKAVKKTSKRALPGDILTLILDDHKPLKRLIRVMKNSDASTRERKAAFSEFAPLLVSHAKPEENVLYKAMKENQELREEAFEGDVEHGLADQMLEEIKRADDEDIFNAKVKVLAELVEHHIKEEEDELLPDFKKNSEPEERVELGEKFLAAKNLLEDQGSDDAPPERKIKQKQRAQLEQ